MTRRCHKYTFYTISVLLAFQSGRLDMAMSREFNNGFFFGVTQCLVNGTSLDIAFDVLKGAGVTSKEILRSGIDKYSLYCLEPFTDSTSEYYLR